MEAKSAYHADRFRARLRRLGLSAIGVMTALTLWTGAISPPHVNAVTLFQTDWPCPKPPPLPIAIEQNSSVIFEGLPVETVYEKAPHQITTCALIHTPFDGVGTYVFLERKVCFVDRCDILKQGPQVFEVAEGSVIKVYINAYQMPPDAASQIYTVTFKVASASDAYPYAEAKKEYDWTKYALWIPIISTYNSAVSENRSS